MKFGWINLFGAIIVIIILIPNIIYALKTRTRSEPEKSISKFLLICEQVGRYASMILMVIPLLINEMYFRSETEAALYFLLSFVLLIAYCLFWILYAKNVSLINGMALAIIPTLIFTVSGVLLRHPLLLIAAAIFGVSHIIITYRMHSRK